VRNIRSLHSGGIYPDLEWHSSGERKLHDGESGVGDLASKVKVEPGVKEDPDAKPEGEVQRTPQQIYLISKGREMHHRFQNSVFYVRSSKDVPDVVRYSDRFLPPANIDSGAVLSHCLGGRKRTRAGVFVPEELCGGQRRISTKEGGDETKKLKGLNLEELEKKIREGDGDAEEEEKQEGEEEEFYEEEGEESDGADYVQNYYESEGDESAGSDGEPTF
jgi:hypothetical protein